LPAFIQQLQQISLQPPQIPYISNLTGTWIRADEATDPHYWANHLRQTVKFSAGISELLKQPQGILLEVGAGRTLSTLTKQHLQPDAKQLVLTCLRHPQEQQSDVAFLLNTLGRLWIAGVEINWSAFYSQERRCRLPLPSYPFERQRYWIDAKSSSLTSSNNTVTVDKKLDIADWFYIPSWKRSLLPTSTSSSKSKFSDQQWLMFVDECQLSFQLINRLEQKGKNVITVKMGEQFCKLSESIYAINPQNHDDYDALLKELITIGKIPENIAYLWGLNTPTTSQTGDYLEFNSLLSLVQTLDRQKISQRLQIVVVSNQIQKVNGKEILNPEKATVLGLCKVIPQEYTNIYCRNIDVIVPDSGTWQEEKLINQIADELTGSSSDLVVAYRDRDRWVQTFESVHLSPTVVAKAPLREQAVYLITGGLEGVEFVLAQYLAQTVQAKLIFIEIASFPDKEEHSQWLANHEPTDEISRKITNLQALEKLGAEVLVVRADIHNYEQMQQSLASEKIGQIHGVIYSTRQVRENLFCSIPELTKPELEELLYSKCREIAVIEKLLQGRTLDFCVILSSLSSILGGFGLATYSALNLFMDAIAHRHNQNHSLPWLTINWDRLQLDATEKQTELAITQTELVEVFQRILSLSEMTQIVISTVDLESRIDKTFKLDFLSNINSFSQKDSFSRYSRPNLANLYVAPTTELEKQIAEMWQEVLGIDQVGIYDNFFDLGGDSLIATRLFSRLQTTFPVELSMRKVLFQASTVAKQVEIIEKLLLEKIAELSEEEVEALLTNKQ
jgi:acyl transferase domain-containing protein/acyl carrier protein